MTEEVSISLIQLLRRCFIFVKQEIRFSWNYFERSQRSLATAVQSLSVFPRLARSSRRSVV